MWEYNARVRAMSADPDLRGTHLRDHKVNAALAALTIAFLLIRQHFPPLAARAPARESMPEIKGRGRPTRSSAGGSTG
jgi:hypothetical protein